MMLKSLTLLTIKKTIILFKQCVKYSTFQGVQHLNNPISTTYPFSSCQLDPTAFLQWICLVPRLQPKIRELKFNLQPSENPLFHAFFTHYLSTLDIKQTHSTCSSLSKLILMSSSIIGSLNLMDFNHCPLAWRSG